jgi:hypothetical protein
MIIRVFPTRTSMTPVDDYAFYGNPPFPSMIPEHDEVHISVVFTWDIAKAEKLQRNWQAATDKPVIIGGPAFGDRGNGFIGGMYLKKGITITSRGCPNHCSFCHVPKREGNIRELPVVEGHIIQDNNFLACSRYHRERVYEMLRSQKEIAFKGGLESRRLTAWDMEQIRSLKIKELWIACDTRKKLPLTLRAIESLHEAGFSQNYIRCFVLIGIDREEEQDRLITLYRAGCLPFAQLFQPEKYIQYDYSWKQFARIWSRPAAYKSAYHPADAVK